MSKIQSKHSLKKQEKMAYWEPHIKACKESGESANQYCRKHKLSLYQFKYWKYNLNHTPKPKAEENSNPSNFIEIKTQFYEREETLAYCSSLTICSSNGWKILLEKPYSQADLVNILTAMRQILC